MGEARRLTATPARSVNINAGYPGHLPMEHKYVRHSTVGFILSPKTEEGSGTPTLPAFSHLQGTLFALYIWTVVAAGFPKDSSSVKRDWRYAGDFGSAQHCHLSAQQLGLKSEAYRCVDTGRNP